MKTRNPFQLKFLKKYTKIYKESGFKGLLNEGGWKFGILIFLFFLIKGLIWLLIPYLFTTEFLI